MSSYVRPTIEEPVFRDSDGRVIDYGNLWADSPPESAYSVTEHPERYAPLHAVADALIEHIRETYDVEIDEGPEAAAELVRPHRDTTRAVRIRPSDFGCATLTLIFTSYPGIGMRAGLLHDFSFPSCGCDACDSTWQDEAEHAFTYPDGGNSGKSGAGDIPTARLEAADHILSSLPDGWAAWPPRP